MFDVFTMALTILYKRTYFYTLHRTWDWVKITYVTLKILTQLRSRNIRSYAVGACALTSHKAKHKGMIVEPTKEM